MLGSGIRVWAIKPIVVMNLAMGVLATKQKTLSLHAALEQEG